MVTDNINNFIEFTGNVVAIKEQLTVIADKMVVWGTKDQLNLKKIESYCEKFLGNFKKPQKYVILKKLPKGPSGKILKLELKKMINEKNQI